MSSQTNVGVHTHITNPLSNGYVAYLACADSWTRCVDEFVIVDGGSDDGSIELLHDWLSPEQLTKVRIISTPETRWGKGDDWSWPQIPVNRQVGFEALDTAWAIHLDADHVLDTRSFDAGVEDLRSRSQEILLNLPTGAFTEREYVFGVQHRPWILNKRLIAAEDLPIAYGIERASGFLPDYPIWISGSREYENPASGATSVYYMGDLVESDGTSAFDALKYGHAFFTPEQCLEKGARVERAISRFGARDRYSRREIARSFQLDGIEGFADKETLLDGWHPPEVRRVIQEFYRPGMLMGARYQDSFLSRLAGRVRKVRQVLPRLPRIVAAKIRRKLARKRAPRRRRVLHDSGA